MSKLTIIKEFFVFLLSYKHWWLLPVVIALLVLGAIVILTGSLVQSPFIYTLF